MNFDIWSINYHYSEQNKRKWKCHFTNSSTPSNPLSTNTHFPPHFTNSEQTYNTNETKTKSASSSQNSTPLSKSNTFFSETDLIDKLFKNGKNTESNHFLLIGCTKFSKIKLYKLRKLDLKQFRNFHFSLN